MTVGTAPAEAAADPVFAVIERHRQATQAWQQHNDSYGPVGLSVKHTKEEIEADDAKIALMSVPLFEYFDALFGAPSSPG